MKRFAQVVLISFVAVLTGMSAGAWSQGYPNKPIRIIIPYPPGGGNDIVVRAIGQKLSENLGQSVVVENKPGGGTLIGAEAAAKSPPDGYTIFLGTIATLAINPSLYRQMPYDPIRDFAPVTQIANYPMVLVTNPTLSANSVADLLAIARARPGKLVYASFGNGSTPHLGMELLKTMAGVDLVHVPYKGAAPALADLLGGQVSVMFNDFMTTGSQIKAGRLKALAVSPQQRTQLMPDLPTVAESGVPGYGFTSWAGLLVPAATPAEIVNRLHAEIVRVVNQPDVARQLSALGADPAVSTPQQFAEFIRSETAKWAKVVKDSGAKID